MSHLNAKMNIITKQLEEGIKEVFESSNYIAYLKLLGKFHEYSLNNVILILKQMPNASYVAGFKTWQSQFNRQVKKGEKAIHILAPFKKKTKEDEEDQIFFHPVSVFDVSQTEGDPLAWLQVIDLQGSFEGYLVLLEALKEVANSEVSFQVMEGQSHGYYHRQKQAIVVKEGMSQLQTIKTLLHEIAHERLHSALDMNKERRNCEIEAESVAYCVCQYYGLDTSNYSFNYIATWAKHQEDETLKQSLTMIHKTSCQLIKEIDHALKYSSKKTIESIDYF